MEWTGRRCATGFIATIRKVWIGLSTGREAAGLQPELGRTGQTCILGRGGRRSRPRWRCAVSACRFARPHSCRVWRHPARTQRGQATAEAGLSPSLRSPAAPAIRSRSPGGFQKNFPALAKEALGERASGKPVEVWFQDEARVGQQGTLTRIWARRGSRPRAPRDRRFTWAYLFGAVCPARGVGAALVLPTVNTEGMTMHLAEIGKCVTAGAIALLIVDGAGWHSSPKLAVPENIVLLKLPPYAPELNPAENIWEYLRGNALSHQIWETYEDIVNACWS